ncbi:hypothetical protein HBI60_020140 [Parastagonospora nodorum]|nr:hypothetical protein HBI60_020140 [Parastagonospora nodorum]
MVAEAVRDAQRWTLGAETFEWGPEKTLGPQTFAVHSFDTMSFGHGNSIPTPSFLPPNPG